MNPDWRIVKVDQTKYCDEGWRRDRGIRACGVYYLVDANLHVHICSLTPSLEAWPMVPFVDYVSLDAAERDDGAAEIALMAGEDACTYFDTRVLARPTRPATDYFDEAELAREDGETHDEYTHRVVDRVRDYLAGNPCSF